MGQVKKEQIIEILKQCYDPELPVDLWNLGGLRMEVTSGGCSGMNYNMSFEKEQKEFDKVFESSGLKVFCDLKSYLYLKGIEVDFSNDILNGGFRIINPNAERTCGCGTSFSM